MKAIHITTKTKSKGQGTWSTAPSSASQLVRQRARKCSGCPLWLSRLICTAVTTYVYGLPDSLRQAVPLGQSVECTGLPRGSPNDAFKICRLHIASGRLAACSVDTLAVDKSMHNTGHSAMPWMTHLCGKAMPHWSAC